ncbi:hypothetical protein [Ensifer sp. 4252]|uniref:hypothetical protein n=1 Tax=Ensifer sp. 4252 TaxID=3373915 RepID=UPI003D202BEA
MADSDNSRTLSTVTRRDFHSLVAASLPTNPEVAAHQNPGFSRCADDPAVAAWHRWCNAWQRLSESTANQQRIETKLFQAADTPIGRDADYGQALEAEERAAIAEDEAAAALWNTPAKSVAGAAAKLDAILSRGQPSPISPCEPWPQIRVFIAELLGIDKAHERPRRPAERDRQPAPQSG